MKAKKFLIIILSFAMIISLCSCGKSKSKKNDDDKPEISTAQQNNETTTITCSEQDFTVECNSNYKTIFDEENGLTIYTGVPDSIPYVLIYRNIGIANNIDTDQYFKEKKEEMSQKYGDDLIEAGNPGKYNIGGKTLPGCTFVYMVDQYKVEMLRCVLIDGNDFVEITAKNIIGEGDSTVDALNLAVSSYCALNNQTPGNNTPDNGIVKDGFHFLQYVSPIHGVQHIENEDFSIDIPEGWEIFYIKQYTGLGNGLGFMAYDPSCPDRKIFYYSCIDPFLRSYDAKSFYASCGYTVYADMPVMEGSIESFFAAYPELMLYYDKYTGQTGSVTSSSFPDFNDVTVLEKSPSSIPTTPSTYENSVARITYTSDAGNMCEGLMTIQTGASVDIVGGPVDGGLNWGLSMCGFTTPYGELTQLEDQLMSYLNTFVLTEKFIQENEAITQQNVLASIKAANDLQAIFDSCNEAWLYRETVHDIAAQKWSDAILGYERVYDSTTDTVYMTDIGYYDQYLSGSSDYTLIDDSSEQYYLYNYSGYIVQD